MDVYNLINNAAYLTKCNSVVENKYIMVLDKTGFWDVYREIETRDTFLIIDKKGNINFYVKLNDPGIIKNLNENGKAMLDVEWSKYGPEIILAIDQIDRIPGFIMELDSNMDTFILQKFLQNREAYIQYIIKDEEGIIKLLTEKIQIEGSFIERLKYYIELDFYCEYPRIKEEEIDGQSGYYIKTTNEIKVLEEVLDSVQGLKIQGSDEPIVVHVEVDNFYKIIFSGDMININNILSEIYKRINVIEEGSTVVRGKPFFKYSKGLLYFYYNK